MEIQASKIYVIRQGIKINQRGFDFKKLYTCFEDAEEEYLSLRKTTRRMHKSNYYEIYTLAQALDIIIAEESSDVISNLKKGVYNQH
jgi:hypothetical protein